MGREKEMRNKIVDTTKVLPLLFCVYLNVSSWLQLRNMGSEYSLANIHYISLVFLYVSIGLFFIKRKIFLVASIITIGLLLFDVLSIMPIQYATRAGFTLNSWSVEIRYVQPYFWILAFHVGLNFKAYRSMFVDLKRINKSESTPL